MTSTGCSHVIRSFPSSSPGAPPSGWPAGISGGWRRRPATPRRLAAVLARVAGQSLSEMTKAIGDDIEAFSQGTTKDDIAVLALRAAPDAASHRRE